MMEVTHAQDVDNTSTAAGTSASVATAGTHDTTPIPLPNQPPRVNPSPKYSDPRYGYRHIRYNSSPKEQEMANRKAEDWWSHASPYSILVTAIGNHWKAGSWERVLNMIHRTNNYGYKATLDEIMDRCQNPYDALGAMRNEAVMRGMEGYDYLCMIDTDVYPEPDMLIRLLQHELPIVAPYI